MVISVLNLSLLYLVENTPQYFCTVDLIIVNPIPLWSFFVDKIIFPFYLLYH